MCINPMHDLYEGMLCPACQCRQSRIEKAKPTFTALVVLAVLFALGVIGRWLDG